MGRVQLAPPRAKAWDRIVCARGVALVVGLARVLALVLVLFALLLALTTFSCSRMRSCTGKFFFIVASR